MQKLKRLPFVVEISKPLPAAMQTQRDQLVDAHERTCAKEFSNLITLGTALDARRVTSVPKLTPEQLANWRTLLLTMIGPFTNMLTDAEIELIRDVMQDKWGTRVA